ncbi:synaptotagmin-12-like isoform X2 [Amphiura filiformis]|uniref:synaptotagmin-12-like isoform X2 n=1 Tax=Amphiura filiformis TaxID=82378 RepID=UPI003B21F87E
MSMIGVALLVSVVSAAAAGIIAAWARYCGRCEVNKFLEQVGLRKTDTSNLSTKPPDIPYNERDEEKIPISNTETAIPSYQVNHTTEIPVEETGQFIQYENIFAKAEKAISAAANESRNNWPEGDGDLELNENTIEDDLDIRKLVRCYSSESLSSVTSESSVQEPFTNGSGHIEVIIDYSADLGRLSITVVQARDLKANKEYATPTDTYVKLYLLPEHEIKGQSRVYRRSLNPVYNERFTLKMPPEHLEHHSIRMTIFTYDRYSRHEAIGETEMRLGDVDLFPEPFSTWLSLTDVNEKQADLGDILFSLSYLPTAERLTVVVVKARNLKWSDKKVVADPFVKVYLLQNGKKISKKKTSAKRGDDCPIYNEAMMYSVPANILDKVTLRITAAENSGGGKTPSIGHVLIGPNSKGAPLAHWNQMMMSLRKPVAMWHPLRK